MEGADHLDAGRRHLPRLLGGGALGNAQEAGGPARDRRGQRDGGVHQYLPVAQRPLQVGQVLGLGPERDTEEHHVAAAGRLRVLEPVDVGVGELLADPAGRLGRPAGVARADHDGHPRPGQTQCQPKAERPGAADHGDGLH
jgi:hypothetical protein